MKSFICVALLCVAAVAYAKSQVRVKQEIVVFKPEPGYHSNLPPVYGVRSCGGSGKLHGLRLEGCESGSTCKMPGDNSPRQSELEFVPSQDTDALGVRLNLLSDGSAETVYERAVSDSAVQGGETYIVSAAGAASEDLKGKTITLQYLLFRVDDNDVETCAEFDIEIV